ncbi:hypothetical protein V1478_015111 [Vespula squamosa]|uniref:Uncharacterized protein n=1 Tax=Vespula squamosa TaxID=30214 RepID=A0ABD2A458_VESSQ
MYSRATSESSEGEERGWDRMRRSKEEEKNVQARNTDSILPGGPFVPHGEYTSMLHVAWVPNILGPPIKKENFSWPLGLRQIGVTDRYNRSNETYVRVQLLSLVLSIIPFPFLSILIPSESIMR